MNQSSLLSFDPDCPRILVFDLDGTLLDSLEDIRIHLTTSLEAAGYPSHDKESVRRMVGHGLGQLVRQALPSDANAQSQADTILSQFRHSYALAPWANTRPYPGIPELLKLLKQRGEVMAVLTNKSQTIAQTIVEFFFPGIFTLIAGEQEGIPRKPDPGALYTLLSTLPAQNGESPYAQELAQRLHRCILIGDSEADIQTAVRAGAHSIGVLWGFRDAPEILAAGAQHLAQDCQELQNLLLGNNCMDTHY